MTSAVALVLNLYAGISPAQSVAGLGGVGILFAVLQIGTPRKGWDMLE